MTVTIGNQSIAASTAMSLDKFLLLAKDFFDFDELRWKLKLWILVFVFVTGTFSICLNTYIVALVTRVKEFRKPEYFPLAINSFIDIFGSGFVVMAAELFESSETWNYDKRYYAFTGRFMTRLRYHFIKSPAVNCVCIHLRMLLTQYATAPCVLLLAAD
ncbi:uncharacterized protein LOC142356628, partial [Convolutriloba macropyga]|uniref:uncharacterized protein LOC142356628 n=1 Tax=Convolutriloba macropyga TaxID=536237 RepID=UPI003F51B524